MSGTSNIPPAFTDEEELYVSDTSLQPPEPEIIDVTPVDPHPSMNLTPDYTDMFYTDLTATATPSSNVQEHIEGAGATASAEPPPVPFVPETTKEHGSFLIRQAARISVHLSETVKMQRLVLESAINAELEWQRTYKTVSRKLQPC